jgi:hypothetical protein
MELVMLMVVKIQKHLNVNEMEVIGVLLVISSSVINGVI